MTWSRIDKGWLRARRLGRYVVSVRFRLLEWLVGPSCRVDSSYVHLTLHLLPLEVAVSWRRPNGAAAWIERMQRA